MVWGVNKHKHSISNVFIFHVVSLFSCFLEIINFSMSFFWGGLIFGPGIFLGFVGSPRNFFPFWVLALLDHPRHLKSRVHPPPPPPPWDFCIFQCVHNRMPIFLPQVFGCSKTTRKKRRKEKNKWQRLSPSWNHHSFYLAIWFIEDISWLRRDTKFLWVLKNILTNLLVSILW